MRDIPGALAERLGSGATTLARCWKLVRRDGVAMGFTEHDSPIEFDGLRFEPEAGIAPSAVEQSTGLSTDSAQIAGALDSQRLRAEDLSDGLWDGAEVELWLVDWALPEARLLLSRGGLGEIRQQGQAFEAEVLGLADRLNRPVGRAYLRSCPLRLGEPRCGIDLTDPAFRATATVAVAVDTVTMVLAGLEAQPAGRFSQGRLTVTAGPLAGVAVDVKAHRLMQGEVVVHLWTALPALPAPGTPLELTAGCDKTAETCRMRFGNILNFGGFPFMPGDDWATANAGSGGPHDGGSLFRS